MNLLPDHNARFAALTDLNRSLLVEAGAGTGKTSLLAGRAAVLLSNGIEPKHVAAITFTEFAASELQQRIEHFVVALSRGEIPRDITKAFPEGLTVQQKCNLERARRNLDQLTCTTIHGFAQALIKPYPAEARIDPGAEIIDPVEADLAFQERYDKWLKQQLSGQQTDGVVAQLVLADERGALALIGEVAQFLRHDRSAKVDDTTGWSDQPVKKFIAVARHFERSLSRLDFQEPQTQAACQVFTNLAINFDTAELATEKPSNQTMIKSLDFERREACFNKNGTRRQLRTKGKWREFAAANGRSNLDADQAFDSTTRYYQACHDALEELLSAAALEVLVRIHNDLQELMEEWHGYKRSAALLDFDDLLYTARNLLAGHEEVRKALGDRYKYILVDEFQDTDPLQIEILWLLCGEAPKTYDGQPLTRAVRPGSLFLVGDPKQAIYRFRGADVNAYFGARTSIGSDALVEITSNFRSAKPILDFVNDRFKTVLSVAAGQPGFAALSATVKAVNSMPAVAVLDIPFDGDKPSANAFRDAEADRVADLCGRLVGNILIRDEKAAERQRPCRFGDVALLAPVGTELWRFEQALEDRGIPVSTQAGKGFFQRQEVHDLIALTRALADIRDTFALGTLLRCPLIGLAEDELLDIVEGLPPDTSQPDRLPNLDLRTNAALVTHEVARSVLEILQALQRRVRSTTPYMLLADAVAALNVRSQLRQRFKTGAERAIANVDLFLEMSRAYDVRGLRAFARDIRANWEEATRQVEGRPDAEQEAVTLITVHAAKGLEWPIVVPINMTGTPHSQSALVLDRRSNRFSVPVLGVEPSGYASLWSWNDEEFARERVRLWYVAMTRARDLLVLPRHSADLPDHCWAQIFDFRLNELDGIESKIGEDRRTTAEPPKNAQTLENFNAEAGQIARLRRILQWQRPSRDEADQVPASYPTPLFEKLEDTEQSEEISSPEVAGSSTRGLILHKLIEELLTRELEGGIAEVERRTCELLNQLGLQPDNDPASGISPKEIAATVQRTLSLPEIAQFGSGLVPERTVFAHRAITEGEVLVSGVADAVVPDGHGGVDAVIDWKSDVSVSQEAINHYRKQIDEYRRNLGAKRALLVFMTQSKVIEIT